MIADYHHSANLYIGILHSESLHVLYACDYTEHSMQTCHHFDIGLCYYDVGH